MKKLSIIIPVFNEKSTILKVIGKVKNSDTWGLSKEIIVVDDFSTDGTRNILDKLKKMSIKVIFHEKNFGKGAAIRSGLKKCTGDIILIQDADMEYDPSEYGKLLKPILEGKAEVVYGTRIGAIKANFSKMYKLHYFGNQFLTTLTNILYNSKITDMETGYKIFKKEVISGIKLRATRFDFEPEITSKIMKKGYKIYEVPIDFKGRKFAEGKKITWVDGLKAAFYLLKYRFTD